jgi:uncharacterized protein YdeI (YjbR/CyaY-like superfamily)
MELYVKNREEWRNWLVENHSSVPGVWLIYYKKPSGKPRIPYNDAVNEALCFGWIDGKIKRINDDYYIQWFTQRRPGSRWSKLNINRANSLISEGLMRKEGLSAFSETIRKPELIYGMRTDNDLIIPDDLDKALRGNETAYTNFNKFSPANRRLYLLWLRSSKREATRSQRITKIVTNSEQNIKPGMM